MSSNTASSSQATSTSQSTSASHSSRTTAPSPLRIALFPPSSPTPALPPVTVTPSPTIRGNWISLSTIRALALTPFLSPLATNPLLRDAHGHTTGCAGAVALHWAEIGADKRMGQKSRRPLTMFVSRKGRFEVLWGREWACEATLEELLGDGGGDVWAERARREGKGKGGWG
ncbi:hypothetical protein MMC13_006085 [Lambiella insularis]|nr:hypothetical protein [Lambiella insularis]